MKKSQKKMMSKEMKDAIVEGVDAVRELVDNGEDVNAVNEDGWTPLQLAVNEDDIDVVTYLISQKANVNPENIDKWTPLHEAAKLGLTEIADILINFGANINAKSDLGDTPLHCAVSYREQKDIVNLLLAKGADVNVVNRSGKTPIDEAHRSGQRNIEKMLISSLKDPLAIVAHNAKYSKAMRIDIPATMLEHWIEEKRKPERIIRDLMAYWDVKE
jgi:ankyrin repeat protein